MKRSFRVIEINFPGQYSVAGAIQDNLTPISFDTKDDYCWLICVPPLDFTMIEQQCNELKLSEYFIVDRKSMIVKHDPKNEPENKNIIR